jgi:hypothetical protein
MSITDEPKKLQLMHHLALFGFFNFGYQLPMFLALLQRIRLRRLFRRIWLMLGTAQSSLPVSFEL